MLRQRANGLPDPVGGAGQRGDAVPHGVSLYLPDLVDCLPGLAPLLRKLEQELGAPPGTARIGAFAAARGNGLTCHMDAEEVFSIQLVGEKRFHIATAPDIESPWGIQFNPGEPCDDDLYPQVGGGFPDPARASFETVEMRPGSVLFMPRGTWHRTEAGSDSLSVSIIVRMPTAFDCALAALRLRMLQDPRWRRPMYGAWGSGAGFEAASAHWREMMAEGGALTEGLALEEALLALLSESERLARAGVHSRYQRRQEARLDLRAMAGGALAASVFRRDRYGNEIRSLQLEIPPPMAGPFQWLAQRDAAFRAQEPIALFPALPADQHLRILDALVRGAYLRQLWFGEADAVS